MSIAELYSAEAPCRYDVDKSNTLTRKELFDLCVNVARELGSNVTVTQKMVNTGFNCMDDDGKGFLTFEEFSDVFLRLSAIMPTTSARSASDAGWRTMRQLSRIYDNSGVRYVCMGKLLGGICWIYRRREIRF